MSTITAADDALPSLGNPPGINAAQHALLWIIGCGGAIALIEPSPYELANMVAIVFFFATGLRMRLALMPLLAMLFLVNIGYTICASSIMDKKGIVNWIMTSWYMAVTAIFFAMVFSEDTTARIETLRRGLIAGGVLASLAAIVGYFSLLPGAHDLFTLYDRAAGTFKDPNVLGAFLVLPALFALQSVVSDSLRKSLFSAVCLGIMVLAILLAFSRAAWGLLVITAAFMLFLMVLTSSSNRQRSRIITMTLAGIAAVAVLVLVLLSINSVGEMFRQRASFDQKYDEGRFGRFGRHVLGAQMALELPLGIGPLQFTKYFPEDTHNSYLNAFMSGGWISGVCYPALIFVTVILGFRLIFVRVPWQRAYLAIFATFLGTVGEAFVIDTDHWRHFWLILGAMWGMFVAAYAHMASAVSQTVAEE